MQIKTVTKDHKKFTFMPLILTGKERLMIWENARRIWGKHKWGAIKELKKMRKEWDRKVSSFE